MIKVENLIKQYGHITASDNVNCNFEKGKITVILGGSGSGKSTLLKQLAGLERPDSGKIFFKGQDITVLNQKGIYEMRKQMGMLFQGAALFNYFNVFDNVAFPLREHTNLADNIIKTIVKIKLELVGLRGVEDLMPSQLSGGMVKRIGLARAIAMDPALVFYDEPSSGLDPISTAVIDKLILDLNKKMGITSIVVSHDIQSTFRIVDNIIILFHGKIIAEGTVDEIKNSDDERVIQFINGRPEGPIPFNITKKDFLEDLLIP